jgi:hypothetical protein
MKLRRQQGISFAYPVKVSQPVCSLEITLPQIHTCDSQDVSIAPFGKKINSKPISTGSLIIRTYRKNLGVALY